MIGLLDDVDADKAVFIGHDWGAPVVWGSAQLHPDRVEAVVGMSVPPVPRSKVPPTTAFRAIFGDNFFYMLYFQEPGVADAELDADPRRTITRMLGGLTRSDDPAAALRMIAPGPAGFIERLPETDGLPDWISADEVDHYVAEFTRTGFTGGLNWYRNMDRNWELMADPPAATIDMPAMFIGGTADPVLSFMRPDRATEVVTGRYREVLIDGAGHWLQQEKPDRVNELLLDFLSSLKTGAELMNRPLNFGVFVTPFHPTGQSPTVALEYDMERVVALDRLGFDEAWFGEHHSGGYELIACPEVFIAAAAERTKHIRLGTGVVSLPYHHPLMVADRWVLLDHLTRGTGDVRHRAGRPAVGRLHDGDRSDRAAPDDAGIAGGDPRAVPRRAKRADQSALGLVHPA